MDNVSKSLIAAQNKAAALFAEVVGTGLIQAGKLESELTKEIHSLRHWILEIHFIDRGRQIGGFFEELLTF
jgi:hypothetical protein